MENILQRKPKISNRVGNTNNNLYYARHEFNKPTGRDPDQCEF